MERKQVQRVLVSAFAGIVAGIATRLILHSQSMQLIPHLIGLYVFYGLLGVYFYTIIPCVHGNRREEMIVGLLLGVLASSKTISGIILSISIPLGTIPGLGGIPIASMIGEMVTTILEITVGFIAVAETYRKL
ncbi:MAG: hypothetical protein V1921_08360 [Candidatus Altiarchaeota archaeon]